MEPKSKKWLIRAGIAASAEPAWLDDDLIHEPSRLHAKDDQHFVADGHRRVPAGAVLQEVIDVEALNVVSSVPAFLHYNYSLSYDPSQTYLVCGGYDGILKLFSVDGSEFDEIYTDDFELIAKTLFTQDNQYVISAHGYVAVSKVRFHRILRDPSAVSKVQENKFSFNPNPTSDMLYLEAIKKGAISIYDINGRKVLQVPASGSAIDVSMLDSGLYLLKFENEDGITSGKFVKH